MWCSSTWSGCAVSSLFFSESGAAAPVVVGWPLQRICNAKLGWTNKKAGRVNPARVLESAEDRGEMLGTAMVLPERSWRVPPARLAGFLASSNRTPT